MANLTGTGSADTLAGTAESDTLTGGAGGDRMTGGDGIDLFVFQNGDSSASGGVPDIAVVDVITDWKPTDRFLFLGANPPNFGSLTVLAADTYAAAFDLAANAFSSGGIEYAAIRVVDDTYVFNIRTNTAVKLVGVSDAGVVERFNFTVGNLGTGIVETGSNGDDLRGLGDGADRYDGVNGADTVTGLGGNDTLIGSAGDDRMFGGVDNDSLQGGAGSNYLRGDEGDDAAQGGEGFDDINGNMGNDTLFGGASMDWVVGGKDNDIIFGESGDDIAYGNLGDDTVGGGTGNDIVRGGQGDDIVRGDDGADTIAGDRGSDTMSGGIGPDRFISFSDAGTDRIIDFNYDEGDRLRLDPGTTFSVAQVDSDVVVDLGNFNRVVLTGVRLEFLGSDWIGVG